MKTLREQMLQEMQLRNYSPRTIATYISSIATLSKYYNISPDKISTNQVKQFLHYSITQKKKSISFVSQTINAYRLLVVDVLQRDWDDLKIKRPRRQKKLPIILSKGEVISLIDSITNIKHKAIIAVIYSGGLRISEVINLRITDIDSKRMQIIIQDGKGHKDRVSLLSKNALELLRQYYAIFRPTHFLFEGYLQKRYSNTSIRKIMKKAQQKANIRKNVFPHTLRHSFATHLLEQGVNIQVIQKLLGHRSLRTTCVYLHVQQYVLDNVVSPFDHKTDLA